MSDDNKVLQGLLMAMESVEGEDVSGKSHEEVEHVWYGKIPLDDQLKKLADQSFVTKLLQEQSQFKTLPTPANPGVSTTVRVRRVNRTGAVLTSKVYRPGSKGMEEKSVEISDMVYDFLAGVSGRGMAKMRYTIEPVGTFGKLELDVFLDKNGHLPPVVWAKYDYEVPANKPETPLPPLPITLIDMVHYNPFEATDEERAALRSFMSMHEFDI